MTLAYTEQQDAELVRLAQGGDTRAFDELVTRYRDKVYRLTFRILRNEDDAAEAAQDALLSAYRGLPGFKAESTFSTWIYRIATNASLMKYRKRRPGHVSYEQSQSSFPDAEPLPLEDHWTRRPEKELDNAELREFMAREIFDLPEDLQTVFVLRELQEESNQDVAAQLGLTVAAVKSRLHRARIRLRDRFDRWFTERAARRGLPD